MRVFVPANRPIEWHSGLFTPCTPRYRVSAVAYDECNRQVWNQNKSDTAILTGNGLGGDGTRNLVGSVALTFNTQSQARSLAQLTGAGSPFRVGQEILTWPPLVFPEGICRARASSGRE